MCGDRWGDRIQEIHLHYTPDDLEQPEGVYHPLRRRYDENLRSSCSPDKRRAGKSIRIAGDEFTFRFGNFGMGAAIAVAILVFALLISGVIQLLMGRRESE